MRELMEQAATSEYIKVIKGLIISSHSNTFIGVIIEAPSAEGENISVASPWLNESWRLGTHPKKFYNFQLLRHSSFIPLSDIFCL